jgi:hypothetical protein
VPHYGRESIPKLWQRKVDEISNWIFTFQDSFPFHKIFKRQSVHRYD